MPFTLDRLPDMPVVVFIQTSGSIVTEIGEAQSRLTALLDAQTEPVILVMDLARSPVTLDDLAAATRGPWALLRHRRIRESVLVTDDPMLRLAAHGLTSRRSGGIRLHVFESLRRALTYCEEVVNTPARRAG